MRFTCNSDQFGAAVALAARHVSARPAVPILAGMVLEAGDDRVRASGYDYEASVSVDVPATVTWPGQALVPGRMFAEVVNSLGAGELSVAVSAQAAELTAEAAEFTLPTLPIADYPARLPQPAEIGRVDGRALATAIGQVSRAAARDDALPVYAAVLVEMQPDRLRLTSTDRFRVAVRELPWRPEDPDRLLSALLPGRLLADLGATLRNAGEVCLHSGDGVPVLGLSGPGWSAVLRTLDGACPRVHTLFDSTFAATAQFGVHALRSAVRQVALVSDVYSAVVLRFAPDEITVSAGADELTCGWARLPARVEGAVGALAVNAGYLLDGLTGIETEVAQLSFNDGIRPALLTGSSDEPTSGGEFRYLVMPRRLAAPAPGLRPDRVA